MITLKGILFFIFLMTTASLSAQIKKKDVFEVARAGTIEEVLELYKIKEDTINSVNPIGFTPLILACYKNNTKVAEFLISKVKDINYNSSNGTALAAAVVKGNYAISEMLLSKNANPNIADIQGITPLMFAVQMKNKALVTLLLQYKADKNATDNSGKKAFEYAVESEETAIINLLKN